ncbi:hypothetical protein GCM10010468_50610 [Actinocorallia longicatena]|uniref:DUF4333 domain-containing protein n=2 Tax=Actinocorallia longicatena TaxID=111803 RepID=A0ABP6QKE7_9ACTN
MVIVLALGGVGAYAAYRAFGHADREVTAVPTRIAFQGTVERTVPLRIQAPATPCPLKLLDLDGNVLANTELDPGSIARFDHTRFQGTVCEGAEVYVNGVKAKTEPVDGGVSFRS